MIIPTNFLIGAIVGAISTYLYKDEASKKWLRDKGKKLKNRAFTASTMKPKEETPESTVTAHAEEVITPEKIVNVDTENTEATKLKNA